MSPSLQHTPHLGQVQRTFASMQSRMQEIRRGVLHHFSEATFTIRTEVQSPPRCSVRSSDSDVYRRWPGEELSQPAISQCPMNVPCRGCLSITGAGVRDDAHRQ